MTSHRVEHSKRRELLNYSKRRKKPEVSNDKQLLLGGLNNLVFSGALGIDDFTAP